MIEWEYYYINDPINHDYIIQWKTSENDILGIELLNNEYCTDLQTGNVNFKLCRLATIDEIVWLNLCIANNKFIRKPKFNLDLESGLAKFYYEYYKKHGSNLIIEFPKTVKQSFPINNEEELLLLKNK